MKSCRWIERVGAYHDGEMSGEIREDFEIHLSDCPCCRDELRSLRDLSTSVREESVGSMPRHLREAILQIPRKQARIDMLPTAKALASVAALLLVISLGFSLKIGDWPLGGNDRWHDSYVVEEWDSEALEEPEAEVTHWVVAGLSEKERR